MGQDLPYEITGAQMVRGWEFYDLTYWTVNSPAYVNFGQAYILRNGGLGWVENSLAYNHIVNDRYLLSCNVVKAGNSQLRIVTPGADKIVAPGTTGLITHPYVASSTLPYTRFQLNAVGTEWIIDWVTDYPVRDANSDLPVELLVSTNIIKIENTKFELPSPALTQNWIGFRNPNGKTNCLIGFSP